MTEEKDYPSSVQEHNPNETAEVKEDEMDVGEREADVYTEEGREKLIEEGEISPAEEGFMEGAEGLGEDATCKQCKKVLSNEESEVIAREIDGKRELFCSEACANAYEKEHTK